MRKTRVYLGVELFQAHFRRIALGVAAYARAQHQQWLLMDSWTPLEISKIGTNVDAAVLQGQEELCLALGKVGTPWIQVSAMRAPRPGEGAVLPDNRAIGRIAGEHFLSRGFRSFAFLGGPKHWYSDERRRGLEEAISNHEYCYSDTDDLEDGWLDALSNGTALLCCNDIRARSAVRILRSHGRAVPEEVAVMGVDDDDVCNAFSEMPISSVDPRSHLVGQTVGAELARLFKNKRASRRTILVPPGGVIVRQSSDIVAISDPFLAAAVATIRERAVTGAKVGDILKGVAVSRRTLERKFESTLGRGIEAEIRRVRIERAKELLNTSDLRIGEVATCSGFSDIFHFSAAFKKATGYSPGMWRRRIEIVA